jgi:peroxiredoxin family protein
MMKAEMRKKNFPTLAELLEAAGDSGVEIHVCQPTLDLMGIHLDELVDYPGLKVAGAASFLETATRSRVNFFIS